VDGKAVAAIALDTTGSSVVPVGEGLEPLDEYYLWCDHRAHAEAEKSRPRPTRWASKRSNGAAGVYSHEWGFAKLLHWLRHNPEKRKSFVTALEHCDMVAATLSGVTSASQLKRSVCAMGTMDVESQVGRIATGRVSGRSGSAFCRCACQDRRRISDQRSSGGTLIARVGREAGPEPGIPIPVGAFDAHWDAIGSNIREGDVVNVVGTSTCIIAMARRSAAGAGSLRRGPRSVHPDYTGIEAGLSATGDIFDAIARRAQTTVAALSEGLDAYKAGQTGLLRLSWDNGDRTVLVNPELGGVTLGWNLVHTAQDELFAAIEGTAFHTRIILERMAEHGVRVDRVINAGGFRKKTKC